MFYKLRGHLDGISTKFNNKICAYMFGWFRLKNILDFRLNIPKRTRGMERCKPVVILRAIDTNISLFHLQIFFEDLCLVILYAF